VAPPITPTKGTAPATLAQPTEAAPAEKTIHHYGYGWFSIDGEMIKLASRKPQEHLPTKVPDRTFEFCRKPLIGWGLDESKWNSGV
jgi:hypothetical protein